MEESTKEQHTQLGVIQAAGEWNCNQVVQGEWACDPNGFIVATANNSSEVGELYKVSLVTGEVTANLGPIQPTSPFEGPNIYNSLGYSIKDGTLWAVNHNALRNASSDVPPKIVKIHNTTPPTTEQFDIPWLPAPAAGSKIGYATGDIDSDGHFYIYSPTTPPGSNCENAGVGYPNLTFYVVDVDSTRSTYLQLVDPTNGFQATQSGVQLSQDISHVIDWGFNPTDGQLYGVQGATGNVVRVDPLTGATTIFTTPQLPDTDPCSGYGAVFFDSDGNLFAYSNNSGNVYMITITGDQASYVKISTALSGIKDYDGARCACAKLDILIIDGQKTVDLAKACAGDVLTYTVKVKNQGSVLNAINTVFHDTIPPGTTLIPGSVTVDGNPNSGNPNDGVPLGNITPGQTVTVTFQVLVGSNPPDLITNTARFTADNSADAVSNEVSTSIIHADFTVEKEADVGALQCNGNITYTISITNQGPDDLNQIEVLDLIDPKTKFVPNSVTVDGVPQAGVDPNTGILIWHFPAHTTKIVQFQVQLVSNAEGWIYNTAQVVSCSITTSSNQTRVKICPCNVQ
ncbi:DUF11 domain-containing protein [Bacillus cereus]|uniref:DUF11 domain-containing protein n=1 Tax=Bacillus cereus TaxID=1396 RepID=UPI000BF8C1B0|nr:DUF11 domain-containing protein [Bacillus cereus]PEV15964.1 hypothetical protein CN407_02690 [Bacillus cereus]PGM62759.1 hypothetical protein CN950_23170 [Bacillus cereus]